MKKEESLGGEADAKANKGDKPGKARKGKVPGVKRNGLVKATATPSADLSGLKDAIKMARMDAAADLLSTGKVSRDGGRVSGKCIAEVAEKETYMDAGKDGAGNAGKGTTAHARKGSLSPGRRDMSKIAGKDETVFPLEGVSARPKQGNVVCNGTDVATLSRKGASLHGQSAPTFPGEVPPGFVEKHATLLGKSASRFFVQTATSISSRGSPQPLPLKSMHLTSGSEAGPIGNESMHPFFRKPVSTVPRAYGLPGSTERAVPPLENGRLPQIFSNPSGLEPAKKAVKPPGKEIGGHRRQETYGMDPIRGSISKMNKNGAPVSGSVPKTGLKAPRVSEGPREKRDAAPQRPVEVKNALQLAERAAAAARQQAIAATIGGVRDGLSADALNFAARMREAAIHRAGKGLENASDQQSGSDSRSSLLERDVEGRVTTPLFARGPLGGSNVRESGREGGVDRLPRHEPILGSDKIVEEESMVDDAGGPTPSVVSSGRMHRSGSFASDDAGSRSLYGDSEDGGSVAGSSVAGSYAGDIDGDFGGSGGKSGARMCRDGSRTRGGRRRGRGSGKVGRGGAGRGSRSVSSGRKGRKPAEGGGKGKPRAHEGFGLVGKTIKLHRDDVDYPNGRWCVADVQQWSRTQRKYLLSYRGRGSAWLPPGWLELKEKRKAQVVTVAPAEVCWLKSRAVTPCASSNLSAHIFFFPFPCVHILVVYVIV